MSPSTTTRSPRLSSRAGAVAFAVVAAGATTLASAVLGVGPTPAQADPGDTFLAIGSSQLVQSEDLAAIQVRVDTEQVNLRPKGDITSCPGAGHSWTQLLPGSGKPLTATWTRRGHDDETLFEAIGQAKTEAQAKRWEKALVRTGIGGCSTPTSNFSYGATSSSNVGSGHATWAVTYSAGETSPEGGVAVIRKGTNVGFVVVSRNWGPADQMMESVAKVSVDRLA